MKKLSLAILYTVVILFGAVTLWGIDFERQELEKEIINRLTLKTSVYQDRQLYSTEIIKESKTGNEISGLCSQFVSKNFFYIDYYIKDLTASYLVNRDKSIKNPDVVKQGYKEYINKNKKIIEPIIISFGLFVKSKGHGITGFAEPTKENFTLTQLKAVAARNIFPYSMLKGGKPAIKICVAGEGLIDFPIRNKALEAFAFESIFNGLKDGKLEKKIQEYMTLVGKLSLSTDVDVATKRAQGAFWVLLFQDKDFENLLLDSYNDKKAHLPFEISVPAENRFTSADDEKN